MTSSRLTIKSLNEEIKKLRQKIEEIELLKIKVKDLEAALKGMKKQNENIVKPRNDLKKHYKRNHDAISLKCNLCETNFSQNCDLELHLQSEHNTEKKFKCDKCEMRFVLKWRLQKHVGIHEEKNISNMKYCH